MRAAASDELKRLEREIDRLNARESAPTAELEELRRGRGEPAGQLGTIRRSAGAPHEEPEMPARHLRAIQVAGPAPTPDGEWTMLRGAQIRETAVRLLVASGRADQAIHCKTWFEVLRQPGF